MSTQRTVGIMIFDDVEVLDFCGPFEVFAIARELDRAAQDTPLFDVRVIAEEARTIVCRNGLRVEPHATFADHPALDILVVPGGFGTRRERENPVALAWVADQSARVELTTSVCTGAFLLAANGLLDGKAATTHWGSIDWLREHHPAIDVRTNVRFVDEGAIVTSAGISAGIDMSLHVIERLHGLDVARQTARYMEYEWRR